MRYLSLTLILLLSATVAVAVAGGGTDHGGGKASDDFLNQCPKTTCGNVEIRFPFRLNSGDSQCGLTGLVLSCTSNEPFLTLRHDRPPFKVTSIDYKSQTISIDVKGFWPQCPMKDMNAIKLSDGQYFSLSGSTNVSFISCSREFTPDAENDLIAGPISCLASRGDEFVYVVDQSESMDKLPLDCMVISTDGEIGGPGEYSRGFTSFVDSFFSSSEVAMVWYNRQQDYKEGSGNSDWNMSYFCWNCENQDKDKECRLDLGKRDPCCIDVGHKHHGILFKVIAGLASTIIFIFMVVTFTFLYISRKADRDRQLRIKVEMFLASYKTTKPTRFNYAGIKKITKRLKNKLGQGGFGSVYKGELPNGIPVAVKMLERSTSEGDDFINEVGTIGKIHHVNIVRLLGFCAEGSRRALVYEFMPNESLEKYIFSRDADGNRPFRMEKLLEIATGIARGVEYLHQGCDQRILHFDIKPHNILLDYEFNPKISDFGLAKLCSRDQSIVTMTAIRGTRGYIAPEVYSRNFGTVSYKSDVYSFGMLLLEMVGGRKNIDPSLEKTNEIYFPEWVYEQLIGEQNFRVAIDMMSNEEETVRKLVIVALWCIQWSPTDRPTMTRVVQMLIASLESLEMPPRPFASSSLSPLNEE